MKRNSWEFSYNADVLLEAARIKVEFHTERLNWWANKRDETEAKIKAEGLEIDKSVAFSSEHYLANKTSYRQPTVTINDDMLRDLQECLSKVEEHQSKIKDYSAWYEVLASQGKSNFPLNQDDWLFFFGK